MSDHISENQKNNKSSSDGLEHIAELLREDSREKPQFRTTSKKVTSKLDLTGIAESNFDELDLDGNGGISREELDKAVSVLTARGEKDEAKVAKTLRDNFIGLSGDDQELKMNDLAGYRYRHDELKKEGDILSDVQKGGADSSFKKIAGQLDSTVNYSQIESALASDNLNAKDRDMLGYMLLNYNQVEELAKKNHPEQPGVTLADFKLFATQRLSALPDAGQMDEDMTKTTVVRRKIRVKSEPQKDLFNFEPNKQPGSKSLKAVGSMN